MEGKTTKMCRPKEGGKEDGRGIYGRVSIDVYVKMRRVSTGRGQDRKGHVRDSRRKGVHVSGKT